MAALPPPDVAMRLYAMPRVVAMAAVGLAAMLRLAMLRCHWWPGMQRLALQRGCLLPLALLHRSMLLLPGLLLLWQLRGGLCWLLLMRLVLLRLRLVGTVLQLMLLLLLGLLLLPASPSPPRRP